jgi:hypothetical protein
MNNNWVKYSTKAIMMVQYHYGIRGWREGVVLRNVTEKTRNAGVFLFYFILNEYWNYGVPN